MNVNDELLKRITALVKKGEAMPALHDPDQIGGEPNHDRRTFNEWKSQSLAFLVAVLGGEHTYTVQFEKEVLQPCVYYSQSGIGILNAVKQDIENGYLTELRTLISAEVFSNFLDMATHLLEQQYYHPAASLVGAVLEDSLRTIAKNKKISVQSGDDLSSLNGKCSAAKIYNSIVSKQISVWTDIRNKADHGNFAQVKSQDVMDMLSGVTRFLMDHLK